MPRALLTDLFLRSARSETQTDYWDTKTPGFGIRVGIHAKTFVAKVDNRRITIGAYPELSLAEARKKALGLKSSDQKPAAKRTFGEAYEEWKEAIASKKPKTQYGYKRMMEKYFLPKLGKKRLAETEYEDYARLTKDCPPSEQAHALSVCRTFLRWCVRPPRRYLPHSPLEGIQVTLGKKRKRILKNDELKTVWGAAVKQGYPHGTVVQLLILTGQRRGEIANLRRPWINTKEKTITLPEWVTKNKKEHTFAYNGMVAAVLETIPRLNSTDLLFPSRVSDGRPISGWSKFKKEMEDGVEGWTLHDLRRTFRSKHGEIGTPREIAERLINHAAGVTTDVELVYDVWTYLPQMREAAERYEQHLETLLAR
jgi:integrase